MSKLLSLLLLIFLNVGVTLAQNPDSIGNRIAQRMDMYTKSSPSATLFVHTDKTVYINDETIWLSAYLLDLQANNLIDHNTLSIAVVSDASKSIVISEQYLMDSGRALGSVLLPDSIPDGRYHLVAYTNMIGKDGLPIAMYTQPITIKKMASDTYEASASLLADPSSNNVPVRISIKTSRIKKDKNGKYPPINITYSVDGKNPKSVLANNFLETLIDLPVGDLNRNGISTFNATIEVLGQKKNLVLNIPSYNKTALSIKTYPEGGNLSAGIPSTVGVEVKTEIGEPVSTKVVLYSDSLAIDTIQTSSSGFGRFRILPQLGHNYSIRTFKGSFKDSIYNLPRIDEALPVIETRNAVVKDTLLFVLKNAKPSNFIVVVQNSKEVFSTFQVSTNAAGRMIKLDLNDIPKGISAITVLDINGKPLCERLFFAHYSNQEQISASLNKPSYGMREKVSMKLGLNKLLTKTASLSVSVAQSNRYEWPNSKDIESYVFLEDKLGILPLNPSSLKIRDKAYLEDVLLIRGWRKFDWKSIDNDVQQNTQNPAGSVNFNGTIKKFGKPMDRPISISIFQDSLVSILTTDNLGRFNVHHDALIVAVGKKVIMRANVKDWVNYKIEVENPYDYINHKLSMRDIVEGTAQMINDNTTEYQYKTNNVPILLNTVAITSKKDYTQYKDGIIRNFCGDYVCSNGYLNCRGHFGAYDNRIPEKGRTYKTSFVNSSGILVQGTSIKYLGCLDRDPLYYSMKGRMISREFYINDFKNPELSNDGYISTLLWQPLLELNSSNDAELSFYTGDIKGEFTITVQGTVGNDVVSTKKILKVN